VLSVYTRKQKVLITVLSIRVFYFIYEDNTVAKRRNLKKEKALRNQAYARHFRKQTTVSSRGGGGKRYYNESKDDSDNQDNNDN
jgi:hypothetical protein